MGKVTNGTFNVPGGFKVGNPNPIDDRTLVEFLTDLTSTTTIATNVLYSTIEVGVLETNKRYYWNGQDRTDIANWIEVGAISEADASKWEILNENPFNLKVPTEAEWQSEVDTWITPNPSGAFSSVLKLNFTGIKFNFNDGALSFVDVAGNYWSSTPLIGADNNSFGIGFGSYGYEIVNYFNSHGLSVRLIVEGTFTQQEFDDNYANETVTINGLNYGFVYNPTTQRIWLDRNLGATQVATSLTDADAYGDLFQWGRNADGHEKRTSNTTNVQATTPQPEHGDFIIGFNNWLTPSNDSLWQGTNGVNNPANNPKLIGKNGKKASYLDLLDKPDLDNLQTNIKERVISVTLNDLGASDFDDDIPAKIKAYAIANNIEREANTLHKWVVENPFFLDTNGVTIKLKQGYSVGATGLADGDTSGKVYTAVDNTTLFAMNPATDDYTTACTTLVTDMSDVFNNVAFNQNIDNWDVSNVTNMQGMFARSTFNQNINVWDVSSLTNMNSMFILSDFNQPLNNWDVSNVTGMDSVFDSTPFNQDISNWNTSSVVTMRKMFEQCPFNQNIGGWNVSSVTNMTDMFNENSQFNQDISSWNVANVIFMGRMFGSSISFNQDLSTWCVEQIPTSPANFDTGATAWVLPKPNWGAVCS